MGKSLQVHKSHKTRFASKASRHAHRISDNDNGRISKDSKHARPDTRSARLKRNKLARDQKRAALLKEKRALSGSMSPPRVIVLFGLSDKVDVHLLQKDLLTLLMPNRTKNSPNTVASSAYKLRTTVLLAPHGDLLTCMEMAKIADLIAFVGSGNVMCYGCDTSGFIDSFGSQCLSVFRAMGLPSTAVLIRDLPIDQKGRNEMKKIYTSCLASELPEDCKYFLAGTNDDLHKFIWLLKEQHFSLPHWRLHRPFILSQEINLENVDKCTGKCSLLLSGYVRAHRFSVNQLVHVSGAGDFQLSKIDVMKDPLLMNDKETQVLHTLFPHPSKLEPLVVENIPDPLAGEQTWPTEAEMAEAEATNKVRKLRKKVLPEGTSDYQAAWIVGGTDEENRQSDDSEDDNMDEENDYPLSHHNSDNWSSDKETCCTKNVQGEAEIDNMMTDDENMTKEQIEAEIRRIRDAHAEDEEFPDEVESPFDIPARKRFAKYRGLKSFRTSSWDPKESLPPEYAKIFAFDNFTSTQKHVRSKVDEIDQGSVDESVPIGSYVRLHINTVPVDVASKLRSLPETSPIIASGLLQHESKMSVLHFSIKKHDSYDAPIKSKENLIFNVGFRQFIVRPLFSSDNLNSDKHKMERFLQPGCFSIASVYCPISFPPLPLIVLKNMPGGQPVVAATGSLRSLDTDRIILKRIILTGYPQRVSKLKASVKYMFHHPEDVRWFKPVDLWTKCGRRGRVLEPVGTHGTMKCLFNGVVQQHDTVCMSLYKRTYPKWPEHNYGISSL